jgi:hypothetical protein
MGLLRVAVVESALLGAVLHVLRTSPKEEMSRVDARPNIASVADVYPSRERTMNLFPGCAVGG